VKTSFPFALAIVIACLASACHDRGGGVLELPDATADDVADATENPVSPWDGGLPGTTELQFPRIVAEEPFVFSGLRVVPESVVMPEGASIKLRVYAFREGAAVDVSSEAALTSDFAFLQILSGAEVFGKSAGQGDVRIEHGSAVAKVRFNVTKRRVRSLSVEPEELALQAKQRHVFRALVTFDDDVTEDVSALAKWTSSADRVAKFLEAPGLANILEGVAPGPMEVTVDFAGRTAISRINVLDDTPPQLRVEPKVVRIKVGRAADLRSELVYADGRRELTVLNWTSTNRSVGYAVSGVALCSQVGTTQLWATDGGQSAFVTLVCESETPAKREISISVFPQAKTLTVGESFTPEAWIVLEDGTEEKLRIGSAVITPSTLAAFTPSGGTQAAFVVAREVGQGSVRVFGKELSAEVNLTVVEAKK
jgi:hypothetical protein